MIQAAKIIRRALPTTGLIGAGVGIGVVFGALILGLTISPSLRGQLFSYAILGFAFAEATKPVALIIALLALYVGLLAYVMLYYFRHALQYDINILFLYVWSLFINILIVSSSKYIINDLWTEIPVLLIVGLATVPCFIITFRSYLIHNKRPNFNVIIFTFFTALALNIFLQTSTLLHLHTFLLWLLGLQELDLSLLNHLLMSSSAGGGSNTGSASGHGNSGITNSGSGSGNGGSGSANTNPAQPSYNVRRTSLQDNLVAPSPNDQVAFEQDGFVITHVWIGNAQTKLLRGVSEYLARQNTLNVSVSYYKAITTLKENYGDSQWDWSDDRKLQIMLKEKNIYTGNRPYERIILSEVNARTPTFGTKSIENLSK